MKQGITFKIGTTNFDEAVKFCQEAFHECGSDSLFKQEWEEVKASRNFPRLSNFLTTHQVDNNIFTLNES
ncbi:hypothetical protein PP175_27830 (plasmid) [Aneurinibacillus sp. Ricciae_BoGa-3]|uniref:hypothetical protein n=1 Tax=Aneurinibacillus sp. Ricciae_BoGa-3 TaxID=3022697 RepID=UPI0023412742|nr:hypothetical protein [Aneurinibacillus sp. Ricciae_BoGa-3]WCK57003.1 hypothetical protein PP175_27830 [Aneurinibacillus sp. Ricciae_BoGa-3]